MVGDEFVKAWCFSYGRGGYVRAGRLYKGEIVLSAHKLYLKDDHGEIASTFIPLEKIYKMRVVWGGLIIYARPSNFMQFQAKVTGSPQKIWTLACDLGRQRHLRKKFFGLLWDDPDFFRVL